MSEQYRYPYWLTSVESLIIQISLEWRGLVMKLLIVVSLTIISISLSQSITELDLSSYGELGPIVLENGTVYACIERENDEPYQYSGILAIDSNSGDEIWFYSLPRGDATYEIVPFGIQFYSHRIFAKVREMGIICINAVSGEEIFRLERSARFIAPMILDNEFLYAATTSEVIKLDALTGEVFWSQQIEETEEGIPQSVSHIFLDEERLYAGCIQSTMRCFDTEYGLLVWFADDPWLREGDGWLATQYASDSLLFVGTQATETTIVEAATGMTISYMKGCRFLAGDEEGIYLHRNVDGISYICFFDPDTGIEISRNPAGSYMLNSLELNEDYIVSNCHEGELRIFSRRDSEALGDEIFSKSVSAEDIAITVQGNSIFAVSEDGIVFFIDIGLTDFWELETGLTVDYPILADEGILVIPSEHSLYLLQYP